MTELKFTRAEFELIIDRVKSNILDELKLDLGGGTNYHKKFNVDYYGKDGTDPKVIKPIIQPRTGD